MERGSLGTTQKDKKRRNVAIFQKPNYIKPPKNPGYIQSNENQITL